MAARQTDPIRLALLALAAVLLGQGLWQVASPSSFHDRLADFGPYNPHDLRDMATFPVAAGVLLIVAVGRRTWRVPVLALIGLQHALHALNHLADIDEARPGWIGPADFVSLAVIAGLCGLALQREASDAGAAPER